MLKTASTGTNIKALIHMSFKIFDNLYKKLFKSATTAVQR